MKTRGEFSKPTPFNYQSHHSLNKFRKMPIQQRAQDLTQDIFKIKLKGQPPKYVTRNTPGSGSKQDQIKQLKRHIKSLQGEVKRKILQNPILSKLLKTKQSSQLSHVDLYIQFVHLKQAQQENDKKLIQTFEEYKKKQQIYEIQINQLKCEISEKEDHFIRQIQKATEQFTILQKEFNKKIQQKQTKFQQEFMSRENKIQATTLLIEELKRKNQKLKKQLKQQQINTNQMRKVQQDKINKINDQYNQYKKMSERKYQEMIIQIDKLNQKIKKLQETLGEKQLQIQELDRFIEVEKDSTEQKYMQIKQKYQQKIIILSKSHEEQLLQIKDNYQRRIQEISKKMGQRHEEMKGRFIRQEQKYKQKCVEMESVRSELKQSIQQKSNQYNNLIVQFKKQKQAFQIQLTSFKSLNQSLSQQKQLLSQQKQSLTYNYHILEQKYQNLTKDYQQINYQKNQLHSKLQKGFISSQKDIKKYEYLIEELEKKIYVLGNENVQLKKVIEEKKVWQDKEKITAVNINKINEESYSEKFMAIGRIEEIRHKLQYGYVNNNDHITMKNFYGSFTNNSNTSNNNNSHNYRSNQSSSLTESIQLLTSVLDKFLQNYNYLNQRVQSLKKQKSDDDREIDSILTYFMSLIQGSQQLQQNLLSYINVRKQISRQFQVNGNSEEYLNEEKKEILRLLIENIIQVKLIKQYSSDQTQSYRFNGQENNPTQRSTYYKSTNHFLSNGSRNSRKNLKNLIHNQQQHKYHSNNNKNDNDIENQIEGGYYDNNADSLDGTYRKVLFEYDSQQIGSEKRRTSIHKDKDKKSIKQKQITMKKMNQKYRSHISTQPAVIEDIQEQSTYQIQDQNENYGNLPRRPLTNSLLKTNQKKIKTKQDDPLKNGTKYKQEMKERLLNLNKQKQGNGITKGDIEKKYFR